MCGIVLFVLHVMIMWNIVLGLICPEHVRNTKPIKHTGTPSYSHDLSIQNIGLVFAVCATRCVYVVLCFQRGRGCMMAFLCV